MSSGAPVSRGLGEVGAVVRQHDADLVGHGSCKGPEEVASDAPGDPFMELHEGELGRAVDSDEQVKLAGLRPDLGDVDVEVADRVALELALVGLVAVDLRQAADAMALKAAMQG